MCTSKLLVHIGIEISRHMICNDVGYTQGAAENSNS